MEKVIGILVVILIMAGAVGYQIWETRSEEKREKQRLANTKEGLPSTTQQSAEKPATKPEEPGAHNR